MKTYKTISEAKKDLKMNTGHASVRYFIDQREVSPAEYRCCGGEESIYRNGLEIFAEKVTK